MRLEELLQQTIDALATLDAGRSEDLAHLAASAGNVNEPGPLAWPQTAAEWQRAAASLWVLGHLVGASARQLALQRRIAGDGSTGYRPEADRDLAKRLNAVLVWPVGEGHYRKLGASQTDARRRRTDG